MSLLETAKATVDVLGVPAALLAAFQAIRTLANGNKESRLKLRHQQAAEARKSLDELFNSPRARSALQMIDWSGRMYQDGAATHTIVFEDIPQALRIANLRFSEKERYIRDCFEDLFDKLQFMEHYTRIEFLHFDDLAVPVRYYARIIAGKIGTFEPFLDAYGYADAKNFMMRAARLPEHLTRHSPST